MHKQSERPPDPRRAAQRAMRVVVRKEPPSALPDYSLRSNRLLDHSGPGGRVASERVWRRTNGRSAARSARSRRILTTTNPSGAGAASGTSRTGESSPPSWTIGASEAPWWPTIRLAFTCWRDARTWRCCGIFGCIPVFVAAALVRACSIARSRFARASGCSFLKVESQNTNPAACRFYAKSGLELGGLRRGVYPEYPDEVQLLWYLNLRSTSPSSSGQLRTE